MQITKPIQSDLIFSECSRKIMCKYFILYYIFYKLPSTHIIIIVIRPIISISSTETGRQTIIIVTTGKEAKLWVHQHIKSPLYFGTNLRLLFGLYTYNLYFIYFLRFIFYFGGILPVWGLVTPRPPLVWCLTSRAPTISLQ